MAKEILKIRIDNGLGNNNPTFKDIELDDYSGKFPRMGFPELTASLMWSTPLDDEWTHKEYVVLRGEKFYITDTPDAEKTNDKIPYKHDLGFTSEFARILGNTYFEDVVPSYSDTYDKPCSNSSKFTFYGTISEFCDRLNCSFIKAGIADSILKTKTSLSTIDPPVGDGYCVMLDPYGKGNVYDPNKTYEFSWEDKSHWEAITEGFNITEIPFERRGKCVIFGAIPKVVNHKFEYGHDNELLSIKHKNAKAKVVNRITMVGSSENIPHYYPNETEYGHISIAAKTGNKVLTVDKISIANMTQLLSRLNADSFAVLGKYDGVDVGNAEVEQNTYSYAFDNGSFYNYTLGSIEKHNPNGHNTLGTWHIRAFFKVKQEGMVECRDIHGIVWKQNDSAPTDGVNLIEGIKIEALKSVEDKTQGIQSVDYTSQVENNEGYVSFGRLGVGTYFFQFSVKIQNADPARGYGITSFCRLNSISIEPARKQKTGYYWDVDGKKYDGVGALGVKLTLNPTDAMIGDGFGWVASGRMPFQDHLVPPKYRNTLGEERFYNALNAPYSEEYASEHPDAYIDPDTNNPYVFPNPFVVGAPSEHIHKNEDIKPTIEGVTNASGQLMGVIADIAYDADDNDALKSDSTEDSDKNDTLKYEHSFFYIKLNIFNGPYGFDLFAHASQTDAMTIQMREGSCNGCKFKIQAAKFTDDTGLEIYKNPIVVQGGRAVGVVSENVIKESNLDPTQQNTQTHSIWICVQKDASTFGVIMPNRSNAFKPKIGDKFNIINIDLPQGYLLAAEKRLEEDGMRDMLDNNEEKFSFDIQASRIFFAENPDVLAQLDEYSVIKVKYNGRIYEQYVNQLSIDCKANEALPNIGIDLTDTLAVGQSFVEQVAERASSLIANPYTMGGALGGSGGLTTRLADLRYLKKTGADRSKGKVASDIGFEVGEFVSGGSGAILYQDPETGQTYLEVDKIKARMKAIFAELEVAKEQSIGGKFDITPGGGIDISFVEETATSYRCYFKAKDEDKGADCRFVVGDQARCQESNIANGITQNASNRYYWRYVTAVNNNESYIELSKTDCDTGSDAPMAGDTVVQLGNRNNPERQSAIVLSTVDAFAPCVTLYNGIDHYSLTDKAVVEYGVDKTKNPPEPFFNCYGRFYYGPKGGNSYLKFEPSVGKLIFSGELINITTLNGKDIDEYIKGVVPPVTQEDIESYVEAIVDPKIEGIQNQIDGVIETWFGDGAPSLDRTKYPMNQWGDSSNDAHSGDLYYDNTTGYAYRFSKDGNTWKWITITDEAITKALAAAQDAKDVADGKRRVFTSQPTANDVYDEGDLWVNATFGTTYSNDILRCVTAKAKDAAFNISHWTLASKYTDDSALNQFISDYEDTIDDIKGQLDGKAETWYQATDPSTAWNTADKKALHKGDLWYNTTNGTTWYWDGSAWKQQNIPQSVFDTIDGKADIFVNEDPHPYKVNDLWFLPKDYTDNSGLGNPKKDYLKGTLMVATQSSDTFNAAHWAKKDRYTDDTKSQQAIDDIAGFQYIRDALVNGATIFNGGLILSQLIELGTWNKDNPSDPTQKAVYAGMNGGYHHAKTIASWWGGDMVDKYYQDKIVSDIVTFEQLTNPLATGYAQALIRMDGSGYLAGGNIRWDEYGAITFGAAGITIDLGGGKNNTLQGLGDSIASLTQAMLNLNNYMRPMTKDANDNLIPTTWEAINSGTVLYAVKSSVGLYSDEFISARGLNPDAASGAIGASALADLTDVDLGNPQSGQSLVYDATANNGNGGWVNQTVGVDSSVLADYAKKSDIPSLTGYATEEWVTGKGYATHLWVASNYVPVEDGKGLSSNDFTDTLLDKLNGIAEGANNYEHPTGGANTTILAAGGRVLSAISVNNLGHVTSVSSKALAATDIPLLAITKISGLQNALDSKLDASVFTDLFEKVNIGTEAAPVYAIRAKYGLYTTEFLSARGVNGSSGSGAVGLDEAQLAQYLTDNNYATHQWVNKQGFLKTVAWGSITGKPTTLGDYGITDAKIAGGVITLGGNTITPLVSHQPIRTLTIQKNGTTVDTFTPTASTNKTINISDVASAATLTSHTGNTTVHITADERTAWNGKLNGTKAAIEGLLTGDITSHTHSYLPLSGGTLSGALIMTTAAASPAVSTKTALSYGRLQCYGTLNINGNTDNSGTEYVNITAGHGLSNSTADGLSIGTDTLTWKDNVVLHSANISSYAIVAHQSLANYVDKTSAQEISGVKTFNNGFKLKTDTSWSSSDRSIPFGWNGDSSIIAWYYDNTDKGLTYNPAIGALKAAAFVRRGGTASQFLKADGSVDSNSYLTTGSASSTYLPKASYTASDVLAKLLTVDGSGSGLDADLIDGQHATAFYQHRGNTVNTTDWNTYGYQLGFWRTRPETFGTEELHAPQGVYKYGLLVNLGTTTKVQMYFPHVTNQGIKSRISWDGTDAQWTGWKTLAFTDMNVASATQLQTARTLWGQSFDGTANVSGDLSSVGNIYLTNSSVIQFKENSYGDKFGIWGFFSGSDDANKMYIGSAVGTYGTDPALEAKITMLLKSGNVGIGTTSPAFKLDVNGEGRFGNTHITAIGIGFNRNVSNGNVFDNTKNGGQINFSSNYNGIEFGTVIGDTGVYSLRAVLKADTGNFGIGVSSPDYKLHVNGTTYATKGQFNTATNSYALNAASFICDSWVRSKGATGWYNETYGGGWYMNESNWIRNYNNKNLYMNSAIIRTDGQIQVGGDGSSFLVTSTGEVTAAGDMTCNTLYTRYGLRFKKDSGNSHYISVNNDTRNLQVCQTTDGRYQDKRFYFTWDGVFFARTGIFSDGYVSARGQNTSDIRLKTDIRDFNATDIIRRLNPRAFKWNAEAKNRFEIFRTDEVQYGLIAQETVNVAPWLVDRDMFKDGYWGVKYDKLIPVLLQAQKEVTFTVDDLLVRVTKLEKSNARLESENRELKRKIEILEKR